jgi:hypothetical protein
VLFLGMRTVGGIMIGNGSGRERERGKLRVYKSTMA